MCEPASPTSRSAPAAASALVRQITSPSFTTIMSPKSRAREERLKKFHDLHGASAASLRRQAEIIALTVKRPSAWVLHPEKTRTLVFWDAITCTALICARSSSSIRAAGSADDAAAARRPSSRHYARASMPIFPSDRSPHTRLSPPPFRHHLACRHHLARRHHLASRTLAHIRAYRAQTRLR